MHGRTRDWIPACAGMTSLYHGGKALQYWIPAFAGMTIDRPLRENIS
ncbi:MAG: hypothetical protein M0Z94_01565 [Dehalococcoidales bacterium]|nr:hypothetical protein [Dehalococcoidales bacterium]